jgi:hypothetical protein
VNAFLDTHAEDLLGVPQCSWWWLAPLPRLDGVYLRAHDLRAALGWSKTHFRKVCLVATVALALMGLQIVVLKSGLTVIDLFEDESLRWIFRAIAWVMASANISLILLALLAIDRVPDFRTNQEEGVQLDRRALLRLAFVPVVLALFAYEVWVRQSATVPPPDGHGRCLPRFRARKPMRWSLAADLTQGFFQNQRSHVVHYLAPMGSVSSSIATERKKPRRIPFQTRAERSRYRAEVAAWRRAGAGLDSRPRRRIGEASPENRKQTCTSTASGRAAVVRPQPHIASDTLVFRDASHLSPAHLKSLRSDEVLKDLRSASTVRSQSKRTSAKGPSNLGLHSKRFVFAVEQEVLRILRESPKEIDHACEFLLAAIEARGPSLDTLRLFDLLAALSFRHQRKTLFEKVQRKAEEYGRTGPRFVEFSLRATRWADRSGKWQQRWAPETTAPKKRNRDTWASLPM